MDGEAALHALGRQLAVNVRGRRSATELDAAQVAGGPKLAARFVRLPAVLEEFRRVAPVAVVLQPEPQPVPVAGLAQTADVVLGHLVGHQPP